MSDKADRAMRWLGDELGLAAAPLGTGQRFKKLSRQLAKQGAANPDALAAHIGRKKYGKAEYQAMAARGRKRKKKG